MRIVLCGNLRPRHSTESDWLESFLALGCAVTTIQEDEIESLVDLAISVKAAEPDLFLYVRTWGLPGTVDEADALFRAMESQGIVTAGVHLDRWRGLGRAHEVQTQAMFRVGHLFTADGDFALEWPTLPGGGQHHWLPPGVRASECCESDPYPPWVEAWDVAFVGSAPTPQGGNYHDEEWPHRRELVAWLRATYGERFVHVGNGGQTVVDDSRNELTTLRGHWCNRLLRSTKVVVGDSCLVTREGRYWSDRVTESYGRGGLLVHPGVDALQDQIGWYPGFDWDPGDWDTLEAVIDGLLSLTNDERDAIRLPIAARVRAEHTYVARARTILETVGLWHPH